MTAEEFINQNTGTDYYEPQELWNITFGKIEAMLIEFAKLKCKEQKDLCIGEVDNKYYDENLNDVDIAYKVGTAPEPNF